MIKGIYLIICLAAVISCKTNPHDNQKLDSNKSSGRPDITGIWTSGETVNATFQIDKDSIYYVDALQRFKYLVFGDSLVIKFAGYDYRCKILKSTKDSLVLINRDNKTVFWRFKN